MIRTMLTESKVVDRLWNKMVHIIIYIQNMYMLRKNKRKTSYAIWFGKKNDKKSF